MKTDDGVDYKSAPKDYASLFQTYYPYVVSIVRRFGIAEDRKEDVASEILLRFYERDFLNKFDPDLVFEYQGESRPARFKSFLSRFVITYVRGQYDRQQRHYSHELLLCDTPVMTDEDSGDTWADLYCGSAGHEQDVVDMVQEQQLVDHLRAHLVTVPRRSRYDMCDLPVFFDIVVAQIRATGELDYDLLKRRFGISSTAIYSWIFWLKANLADALARPAPVKRPRRVRA